MSDYCIQIKGEVFVNTPSRLNRLSTWVLLEQEDWFEKEIHFLRRWLKPGMRAIDIGANIGVYALTIAKFVGPTGAVWAFEPTPEPADLLRRSIARNGFANLHLIQKALSDVEGRATLHLNLQSELNSLVHIQDPNAALGTELVEVSTLDRQHAVLGWDGIDFVKIDAEGVGARVLAGGAGFFAAQSPLVMFEANDSRSGGDPSALPAACHALGFDVYRLVGPDLMLVPLQPREPLRPFELNLFACKADRAASLAAEGLLVATSQTDSTFPEGGGNDLFARQVYAPSFGRLAARAGAYARALDAYAVWRDLEQPPQRRYGALRAAFVAAQEAAHERANIARIATLARIAFEASERHVAVEILPRLIPLLGNGALPPDEPLFPPAARYDTIDPQGMTQAWLVAAAFEAFETGQYFSGCFKPVDRQELSALDWLQSSPFASAPIERRRQLQRWLAGLQPGLAATPILAQPGRDHLNPRLWTGG